MDSFKEMPNKFLKKIAKREFSLEEKKEFLEAIEKGHKELLKKKDSILNKLIKKNIITEKERKIYSQDYLVEYLNIIVNLKEFKDDKPIMITVQKEILTRKEELENKFRVKIQSPSETLIFMKKEEKRDSSYIG